MNVITLASRSNGAGATLAQVPSAVETVLAVLLDHLDVLGEGVFPLLILIILLDRWQVLQIVAINAKVAIHAEDLDPFLRVVHQHVAWK